MYLEPVSNKDSVMLPYGLTYRIEELERKVRQLEQAQVTKDKAQDDKMAEVDATIADIISGKKKVPQIF